jgi:extradiol dioxygenase family protein
MSEQRPGFHLAVPVNDIQQARAFYGGVLGLTEGRSADNWVDWNFYGHQFVTHEVTVPRGADERWLGAAPTSYAADAGHSSVDGHRVPVPHFGLLLSIVDFHALADRLRAAGVEFVIEPYLRFAGQPGEQWTMFLRDPSGNAMEFKAFRDESQVFAV